MTCCGPRPQLTTMPNNAKSKKKESSFDRRPAIQNDIADLGMKMNGGFKNVEARFKNLYRQIAEVRNEVKRLNESCFES